MIQMGGGGGKFEGRMYESVGACGGKPSE